MNQAQTIVKRIVKPATAVMNRLSYPKKFTLIGFFLLFPLIAIIPGFYQEINMRISHTLKEREGLLVIPYLGALVKHLQEHRGMANAFLTDKITFKKELRASNAQILIDFEKFENISSTLTTDITRRKKWKNLKREWGELEKNYSRMLNAVSFKSHTIIIKDVLLFIRQIGDNSGLITDPELDSYYLMYLIVYQLYESMEAVGEARGLGTGYFASGIEKPQEVAFLHYLSGKIKSGLAEVNRSLYTLYRTNPDIKEKVIKKHTKAMSATDSFMKIFDDKILNMGFKIQPKKFFPLGSSAIEGIAQLQYILIPLLDARLQERINTLQNRRYFYFLLTAAAIAVAFYLFFGFYFSAMSSISSLVRGAERIARGEYHTRLSSLSKDELDRVMQTFNKMAAEFEKNITAHEELSQKLANSERDIRAIFDRMQDTFYRVDIDGCIIMVSPSVFTLLGYLPSKILGQKMADFYADPNGIKIFLEKLKIAGGQVTEYEALLKGRDDREVWVSTNAHFFRNERGEVAGVEGTARDITAYKYGQEALRQARDAAETANRAKSEFLSSMSHELRTPLNAVLGFAQLLEYDADSSFTNEHREYIKNIIKGGHMLLELIDDVLNLVRIEAGRIRFEITNVTPADIIVESIMSVASLALENNIKVIDHTRENQLPDVRADSRRFKQVMLNLLTNAIKYNKRDGEVHISCSETSNKMLRISVIDTGLGIPREKYQNIFEPFDRLGAESGPIQGTGIGLSIAQKLIQYMNGRIGFESEVGKGSTFWLELPVASETYTATTAGNIDDAGEKE